MKILKLILAGLLSTLITFSSYAGTQKTNLSGPTVVSVKLVKTKSPKGKFRAPEKCPIDCCYCFDNLYVSSTKNVEADIYVINTTTGDFCSEAVTLSQEPVSIPAFGDGEYRIEVTLSDGDIYYGEFEIE